MRGMEYKKQQAAWRKRREKIAALLASGVRRKDVAKRMGITRQRLSQLERPAREKAQGKVK